MTPAITPDQLTTAVISLVNNTSPHTGGIDRTATVLAEFLTPLTHEGLKSEHIRTILEHADDYIECTEEAGSPWACMEQKAGSYRRHAQRALDKVRVAAMAICEGGVPA